MNDEVRLRNLVWHSTLRLIFSFRGLIALLFSVFMISMIAYLYDKLPPSVYEIIRPFASNLDLQFQWLLFDNSLSKLITLFIAPIFIFDAISGDRSYERLGLMLSRPITRTQYLLTKLFSATLAIGIIFLPTMALGYPVFMGIVKNLTSASYFSTSLLIFLLAFFTMCVGLLVSALTKKTIVSFIAMFGLMAILMMPNASKYTSPTLESVAMATPHYYATYFSSHAFDATLCLGFAIVILLFSLPFILATILRFRKENL